MIEQVDLKSINNSNLYKYMLNHLEIVTVISGIFLIKSGTIENLQKKKQLWKFIQTKDKDLYKSLRYGFMGRIVNLPGKLGRQICILIYKIFQTLIGFN